MLWVKAFHIIFMTTWMAGLFYLPRLYVYHADTLDDTSNQRFKIMERRLFFGIMTPGMLFTLGLGVWLMAFNMNYYLHAGWMHAKLALVALLVIYHLYCWQYMLAFKHDKNRRSSRFYRVFNEVPTLIFVAIVVFVIVKPF